MKKVSKLFYLGIFSLLLVVVFSVLATYEKKELDGKLASAKSVERNLQAEVLLYEEESAGAALTAKETLEKLKEDAMLWSQTIRDIRDVVRGENGDDIVQILSYSGSDSGVLSMSMKTNPTSLNPYFDVANVIEVFDDSLKFEDVFVSSIGGGVDQEGGAILTFPVSVKYLKNSEETSVLNVLNENLSTGVTR